jgi:threonine synthase
MDIMVSSNFERLLFDLHGRDGHAVKELLENASKGPVSIEDYRWKHARQLFDSDAVDDKATCETIREVFDQNEYLLDPHTAIGVRAARNCRRDSSVPMITLGTAHPAKFPDAIAEAGLTIKPQLPLHMADLFEREERYTVLDNDKAKVQDFMARHWKNA